MELSQAEQSLIDQRLSRKDVVLKLLRTAIVDGRLPPGTRLDQNKIAADFSVSRMPVREALKQLETEGLVVVFPYRGVEVAKIDSSEVSELFAIRGALERLAVGQAVDAIQPRTMDKLEALLNEMDTMVSGTDSSDGWSVANRTFHDTINAASGWPLLLNEIATYRDKVDRYARLYFAMGGRRQSQQEHWHLLAALRARNRPLAEKIIEDHSNSTAALMMTALEANETAKNQT